MAVASTLLSWAPTLVTHDFFLPPSVEEAVILLLGCPGCFNTKIKCITDVSQGAESEGLRPKRPKL